MFFQAVIGTSVFLAGVVTGIAGFYCGIGIIIMREPCSILFIKMVQTIKYMERQDDVVFFHKFLLETVGHPEDKMAFATSLMSKRVMPTKYVLRTLETTVEEFCNGECDFKYLLYLNVIEDTRSITNLRHWDHSRLSAALSKFKRSDVVRVTPQLSLLGAEGPCLPKKENSNVCGICYDNTTSVYFICAAQLEKNIKGMDHITCLECVLKGNVNKCSYCGKGGMVRICTFIKDYA